MARGLTLSATVWGSVAKATRCPLTSAGDAGSLRVYPSGMAVIDVEAELGALDVWELFVRAAGWRLGVPVELPGDPMVVVDGDGEPAVDHDPAVAAKVVAEAKRLRALVPEG